ncbi:hypothetical protein M885DRAFT_452276 [Pelagophyceae sp. CCMP2097]|nr:hypothetical protein M885DRAFT_452276 [Pelagophyceae sp. CCMP2097]
MDLQTLRAGVERGAYPDVSAFAADARRIFRNAMTFNVLPDSAPHMAARDVHERLEAELTALDTAWAEAKRPRTMKGGQPKREAASHYADDDYEYYDAAGGPSAKKKAKSGKGKKGPGIADRAPLRSSSDMVPVTQLVDMQRQMELMHQTILALQRQASQTDMQVQMNMEAGLGPGGAAPASTAALARAKASKPLTFEEKAQLSDDINSLPAEKLGSVIKIVQEHMPLVSRAGAADDEIEVDIETLDNETLRHLQRYVKTALAPKARQPRASPKPGDGTAKKGRAKSPPPAYATPAAPKAPPHDAYPNLGAGFDDEEDDDDLAYDVLGD